MPEQVILDMTRTYMYEGEEYILTGRTAVRTDDPRSNNDDEPRRQTRRTPRRVGRPRVEKKPDFMVEIQPAPRRMYGEDRPVGIEAEPKWVKYSELYVVFNQLDEDEDVDVDELVIDDIDELEDLKDIF